MRLPDPLRAGIDEELATIDRAALARAVAQLSDRYRAGKFGGAIASAADRAAYLATRVPATFAANRAVFSEFARHVASPVRSLLDLGSGPGTALWAAAETLASVERFTAVERDAALFAIGRRLATHSPALQATQWLAADISETSGIAPHDIVVLSYALGELPDAKKAVEQAWRLANVAVVIIEPGTPRAFETIARIRELLIQFGATLAAPCPHHEACPLAVRGDWCHFSVRLERTAEHRRLKGGALGYEDEKFSYLVACKTPVAQAESRIVRHPLIHPGHIKLTLCTANGLQQPTITKSQKELYRQARRAEWGDAWPK